MLTERIAVLEVGDLPFVGLRIIFEIKGGYQNLVKRAFFTVYNMSESSRNQLEPNQPVKFSVLDKDGAISMIFYGYLSALSPNKETDGSEVTKLYCWSGNSAYIQDKRSVSFDKNSTGSNVLDWLKTNIAPIEVTISTEAEKLIESASYAKGYKLEGTMDVIAHTWANDLGTEAILDDTKLFIGNPGEYTHEVNSLAKYGMAGIPSITVQGIEVTTELNPTARIYDNIDVTAKYYALASSDSDQVTLNNRSANGIYRVINLGHKGDTHSELEWFTTYEGILNE